MPSYITPKKNTEFVFSIGLFATADSNAFVTNPTIAAGDFKVSIDNGALNNLTNIPVVTPAGSKLVKFTMTSAEMNGDNITIIGSDATGAEWKDIIIGISTTARQIDDLAFPTVSGRSLNVSATGEADVVTNIKKNTLMNNFVFVITDSTNHNPMASATVTGYRSIDGGTFAACANAVTEVSNGVYKIDLAATDLNGNNIILRFTATGADDRYISLITQP